MPPSQNQEIPKNSVEAVPANPGVEAQPLPAAPESAPQTNADASQQAANTQPVQLPQIPTVPSSAAGTPVGSAGPVPSGGNPAIADDVDVIEKEWVDQADKIIERTKSDPYMEEEAIESLQIDYLKKRYGHDVKKPNNQGGA